MGTEGYGNNGGTRRNEVMGVMGYKMTFNRKLFSQKKLHRRCLTGF